MSFVGYAFRVRRPWLTNPLQPKQPVEVWLEQAGMNWRIEETEALYSVTGGQGLHVKNYPYVKIMFRSDVLTVIRN